MPYEGRATAKAALSNVGGAGWASMKLRNTDKSRKWFNTVAAVFTPGAPLESVSVAQTLAAKRRERIDPNQELIGLGASNLAAAIGGGYPVTGGFAPVRMASRMPT